MAVEHRAVGKDSLGAVAAYYEVDIACERFCDVAHSVAVIPSGYDAEQVSCGSEASERLKVSDINGLRTSERTVIVTSEKQFLHIFAVRLTTRCRCRSNPWDP